MRVKSLPSLRASLLGAGDMGRYGIMVSGFASMMISNQAEGYLGQVGTESGSMLRFVFERLGGVFGH